MKLIDLLVQELPKRGGWPEGVYFLAQDGSGILEVHHKLPTFIAVENGWSSCTYISGSRDFKRLEVADDQQSTAISREQYESVLAASKQPAWNGEGIPPIGLKCLTIGPHGDDSWHECTILAHTEFSGKRVAVFQYGDTISHSSDKWFKPLATEAERRREDLKAAIAELCRQSASNGHSADLIYDAIAAGKIPGVKLAD